MRRKWDIRQTSYVGAGGYGDRGGCAEGVSDAPDPCVAGGGEGTIAGNRKGLRRGGGGHGEVGERTGAGDRAIAAAATAAAARGDLGPGVGGRANIEVLAGGGGGVEEYLALSAGQRQGAAGLGRFGCGGSRKIDILGLGAQVDLRLCEPGGHRQEDENDRPPLLHGWLFSFWRSRPSGPRYHVKAAPQGFLRNCLMRNAKVFEPVSGKSCRPLLD